MTAVPTRCSRRTGGWPTSASSTSSRRCGRRYSRTTRYACSISAGEQMSASDLAIVAALIFVWATLSARLERFDVTAPITFILAGLLLTHGPLAPLGFAPSHELVKTLAEVTLVLVLFCDASRVGLRDLRT